MIKLFAKIYSTIHRVMIVVGTITMTAIGGILGYQFGHQIGLFAYQLFGWRLSYGNTTFLGIISGLIIAFTYYGREAMIIETYEASKKVENKVG